MDGMPHMLELGAVTPIDGLTMELLGTEPDSDMSLPTRFAEHDVQ
jgi:hypothetical protein